MSTERGRVVNGQPLTLEIPENQISRLVSLVTDRLQAQPTETPWLTAAEAADHTRMSRKTIYRLAERRNLPHVRLDGGKLLFNRQELDNWLRSHHQEGLS